MVFLYKKNITYFIYVDCRPNEKRCYNSVCIASKSTCPSQNTSCSTILGNLRQTLILCYANKLTCISIVACEDGACLEEEDVCDGWFDCTISKKDENNCKKG